MGIRSFIGGLVCAGACPGGHIGPPLRKVRSLREPTESVFAAVWPRGGTEPAPYTMVEGMRFFHKGPGGTGSAERSGERGKRNWSIRVLPNE